MLARTKSANVISGIVILLSDIDVASREDDDLAEMVVESERLLNAVSALSAAVIDEFDRQGLWERDGALSAAAWAGAAPAAQLAPCERGGGLGLACGRCRRRRGRLGRAG